MKNYEPDSELDGAYTHRNEGVAYHILGWETEPDEDTEWTGQEVRTGRVLAVMVGDDYRYAFDLDELTKIDRESYCGSCGQIGCTHDGYEREDEHET